MPSKPPLISAADSELLRALGAALRNTRKRQGVTAVAAAQAAGISRPTLQRVERGESNVAMASWIALSRALGLEIGVIPQVSQRMDELPPRIALADYAELKRLAWQLPGVEDLSPEEALQLYERNWRHIDPTKLDAKEADLVRALSSSLGGGRLLV